MLAHADWLEDEVLAPVPHRQYVFTVPRALRGHFRRDRRLLGELCRLCARLLGRFYRSADRRGRPGFVLYVQTFGDLVTFNPHIHALVADGVFLPDGTFRVLPALPEAALTEALRRAVLALLVRRGVIDADFATRLLGWRHSGFSVHNQVRIRAGDAEGRRHLARYMNRAPLALEKMRYQAESGMVIYRSRMHARLERNFQLMPGARWLELLLTHVPDRGEHLVRYYGHYSSRSRGERAKAAREQQDTETAPSPALLHEQPEMQRARASWARLIARVYQVDPLVCPRCAGPTRAIALIEESTVVRRILEHLGEWSPREV